MSKQIVCAGVIPVVFYEGEFSLFLVRHRKGDYWGFPKGQVDVEESLPQAAIRELQEETQLVVAEWLDGPPLQESYQFEREGHLIHKEVHYFIGKITESTYTIQEREILEGRWASPAQAQELLTFIGLKQLCAQACQRIREGTFGKIV